MTAIRGFLKSVTLCLPFCVFVRTSPIVVVAAFLLDELLCTVVVICILPLGDISEKEKLLSPSVNVYNILENHFDCCGMRHVLIPCQ